MGNETLERRGAVAAAALCLGCACGGGSTAQAPGSAGGAGASTSAQSGAGGVPPNSAGSAGAPLGGKAGEPPQPDAGGDGSAGEAPQSVHVFTPCPSAADGGPGAVGVWQNITPQEVCLTCLQTPNGNTNFGTAAVLVNPLNPAVVYLGTEEWGFFKSEDCGTTWKKTNTGTSGAELDKGSQWTMLVDPVDPQVIYTNSGFGTSGVFKSTNGGVDWQQMLPPDIAAIAPYDGFMGTYNMDPKDHLHILASFHAACEPPMVPACFIESKDGGKSWTARNGDSAWGGGEHTILEFLDSTTWLFGNQEGMWRSTDSGVTWKQLSGTHSIVHHQQLYRAKPGVYFQSALEGLMYSSDNGESWTILPGSPQAAVGVVGTGKTVYTSKAGPWQVPGLSPPEQSYFSVSEGEPLAAPMALVDAPAMVDGGLFMAYDPDHHIVYSSNFPAGVWRVVVEAGDAP